MVWHSPDRRLIRRLARLAPADLEAVLDTLAPDHRRRVGQLLTADGVTPVPVETFNGNEAAVSPWLAERASGQSGVTPATRAALTRLTGQAGGEEMRPSRRPSLIERGVAALSAGRPMR
jgi:hypothetical protein